MDAERYRRVRALLHDAARLEGADRDAFLADACGDDARLRAEVESLLGATGDVPTAEMAAPIGALAHEALGPATPRMPRIPDRLGPYVIERELGRGGMGVVFVARDAADVRVALKVIHPSHANEPAYAERFVREARLGLRVSHENVVQTLDAGSVTTQDVPLAYLVMEYVEGRTLRDLLQSLERVPETLAREIAIQVARGPPGHPRRRDRPPGPQARERADHGGSARAHHGSGHREAANGLDAADLGGSVRRLAAVRLSRTAPRRHTGAALGPVRTGPRALRAVHGAPPIRGRHASRRHQRPARGDAARGVVGEPGRLAVPERRHRRAPQQGSDRALPVGPASWRR